jgi:hypothetical protein
VFGTNFVANGIGPAAVTLGGYPATFVAIDGAVNDQLTIAIPAELITAGPGTYQLKVVQSAAARQIGTAVGQGVASTFTRDCPAGSVATGMAVGDGPGSIIGYFHKRCRAVSMSYFSVANGAVTAALSPTVTATAGDGLTFDYVTLDCPDGMVVNGLTGRFSTHSSNFSWPAGSRAAPEQAIVSVSTCPVRVNRSLRCARPALSRPVSKARGAPTTPPVWGHSGCAANRRTSSHWEGGVPARGRFTHVVMEAHLARPGRGLPGETLVDRFVEQG